MGWLDAAAALYAGDDNSNSTRAGLAEGKGGHYQAREEEGEAQDEKKTILFLRSTPAESCCDFGPLTLGSAYGELVRATGSILDIYKERE